jgi:hypothetical protein
MGSIGIEIAALFAAPPFCVRVFFEEFAARPGPVPPIVFFEKN